MTSLATQLWFFFAELQIDTDTDTQHTLRRYKIESLRRRCSYCVGLGSRPHLSGCRNSETTASAIFLSFFVISSFETLKENGKYEKLCFLCLGAVVEAFFRGDNLL